MLLQSGPQRPNCTFFSFFLSTIHSTIRCCTCELPTINKSYCSTVHFLRSTSNYQTNNTFKHFKTLRHVSTLSIHHQGALFLDKIILQYSKFNSYLQTKWCGSISCCVGMCCGAVAKCASYDAHLATAPQHNMICCHNTSFANTN